MTQLREGRLTFVFHDSAQAEQYDEWSFYRNQFERSFGGKAVDFLCLHQRTTFLIEVKDYSHFARTRPQDLADEMARKVRDTMAGLVAAAVNANDDAERAAARSALHADRWRVVLHLEQPRTLSRLRPQPVDPANLVIKLKQRLKALDPHPRVMSRDTVPADACWGVQ